MIKRTDYKVQGPGFKLRARLPASHVVIKSRICIGRELDIDIDFEYGYVNKIAGC